MLDALPAWIEVPDLIMETKEDILIPEAYTLWKRDEVACERRERRREY